MTVFREEIGGGEGDRETAVTATQAQDDGAWSRLEVVEAEKWCDSEFILKTEGQESYWRKRKQGAEFLLSSFLPRGCRPISTLLPGHH